MVCTKCLIEKTDDEFSWAILGKRRRRNCKECHKLVTANHYQNHKEKYKTTSKSHDQSYRDRNRKLILGYLANKSCVDCGLNDIRVLQFDHITDNKRSNVSALTWGKYSWKRILEEITKCEIRCANCHIIKTAKQFSYRYNF